MCIYLKTYVCHKQSEDKLIIMINIKIKIVKTTF